jgi:hypothetical protein
MGLHTKNINDVLKRQALAVQNKYKKKKNAIRKAKRLL